uniref:Aminotransferase-like plant mobile domain-containing protein n=1 Tax=Aegilops tauschii TaxID=37682 RepID=N1QR62_AEGTA
MDMQLGAPCKPTMDMGATRKCKLMSFGHFMSYWPDGEPPTEVVASPISDRPEDSSRNTLADATLTSRLSVQKFRRVVSQFSNFKRGLMTETGFGGLMHLKITHKLNLKFSWSLMFRVDPDQYVLELDQSRKIIITDEDVNDVFGLPQGSRIIPPGHSDLSEVCLEFSRLASTISTKGVHSLKAAEFILSKQLDENSSKVGCECFKIAFVILSFGHVLNPCARHDYTSVDYWAALVVPSEINSYNWCRLVKDSLMKGVRKIKSDIANGNNTIHIVGCHLLLQVIALDKIEKSSRHIAQNILPCVKVFDHESVKKATDSITSHQGQEVIFAGSKVATLKVHHPNHITNKICDASSKRFPVRAASKIKPRRSSIGPVEFANIMRRKYPNMADGLIGTILKEHNTRLMPNMTEIRHTTQIGMLKFLDKLAGCLSSRCICCQLAGLTTCRLVENNTAAPLDMFIKLGNGYMYTAVIILWMTPTLRHYGIYSLFMARHYDGESLRIPTTKENICSFRRSIVQDVMKLEDNKSDVPYTAMQHIGSSINNL